MKLANELIPGRWIPMPPALEAVLRRLQEFAESPAFAAQYAKAMGLMLRPYAGAERMIPPLPAEVGLALLCVIADYFPDDGQLSLVEQLRDTITEHVSNDERAWLDPIRHSYQDVLEIVAVDLANSECGLTLRSLGDHREYRVPAGPHLAACRPGQAMITRLIRQDTGAVLPGVALRVSETHAALIFEAANDWRRQLEIEAGAFSLREWEEFAKRYGHVLLWQVADARLGAIVHREEAMQYRTPVGEPFLYARALYEHADETVMQGSLGSMTELTRADSVQPSEAKIWLQRERIEPSRPPAVVARVTVTPTQLLLECDSPERLDALKHRLASVFGFRLHFAGEAAQPPRHILRERDLADEAAAPDCTIVDAAAVRRLWTGFLESVYLDWAERPSPALASETPRHAARTQAGREQVAALIAQIERNDPLRRATGQAAYDYRHLREQTGLV